MGNPGCNYLFAAPGDEEGDGCNHSAHRAARTYDELGMGHIRGGAGRAEGVACPHALEAAYRDAYAYPDEYACAHRVQQPYASWPRRGHRHLYPTDSFHCVCLLLAGSTASARQKVAREDTKQIVRTGFQLKEPRQDVPSMHC